MKIKYILILYMAFDIYNIFSFIGFMVDVFKNCRCSRRICGVVIGEKAGKSNLCNSLNSQQCSLVDFDEILKNSSENADKIQRLKVRGEYATLTLLLVEEASKLIKQVKKLHKHKRLVIVSSSTDLLDAIHINYGVFVPSNQFSDAIKSKLNSEEVKNFENSRTLLIQNNNTVVYNSWDELSGIISEKFKLSRKL